MKCVSHLDKDAIGICVNCGKALCSECKVIIKGKIYCKDCVEGLIETEKKPHSLVIVFGYILAVFFTIFGIIIGAWLWGQDHPTDKLHGKIIVVVGIICTLINIILVLTGVVTI
ncbi:MAG TPA: hypothetical protein VMW53_02245 [archaeon]|nr:hypothetical protein [archaeon]